MAKKCLLGSLITVWPYSYLHLLLADAGVLRAAVAIRLTVMIPGICIINCTFLMAAGNAASAAVWKSKPLCVELK